MNEGRLAHCVAVVTGASRGIGEAIARAYAREGAAVVVCSRRLEHVDAVARTIRDDGGRALAVACDITRDEDAAELLQATSRRFGTANVVVNNAGIYSPKPFRDASVEDFRRLMEVNYLGAVRITRAFLEPMAAADFGRVIFIASTAGKYGSLNQSMYNGSKHAVMGLMRCLALELAKTPVRVNAICPGFVDTPILQEAIPELAQVLGMPEEQVLPSLAARVPIGRLVTPGEVAQLAVYLASRDSDGMTGHGITLAGGMVLI